METGAVVDQSNLACEKIVKTQKGLKEENKFIIQDLRAKLESEQEISKELSERLAPEITFSGATDRIDELGAKLEAAESGAYAWNNLFEHISKLPQFKEVEQKLLDDNCQSSWIIVAYTVDKIAEDLKEATEDLKAAETESISLRESRNVQRSNNKNLKEGIKYWQKRCGEIIAERDEANHLYANVLNLAADNDKRREEEMYKRVELEKQVADLKQANSQLADAAIEKPPYKHELQVQVVMLRGALENIMAHTVRYAKGSDTGYLYRTARQAIESTPTEAAERVQGMVDVLECLARLGHGETYGNSLGNVMAQEALAKYRGEVDNNG